MNAPRSTGPRSHDHEDRHLDPDGNGLPESRTPEPRAGVDATQRSAAGRDQRLVPSTPGELVAMQQLLGQRQPPPAAGGDDRVARTLGLLRRNDLTPWECQQITLALLQQLESYHQAVVAELHDSSGGTPAQVACWAIDGDRLMHCRRLLESVTLI